MDNFDLKKYLTEGRLSKYDIMNLPLGKKIGFENIIHMVQQDMDYEELGVEDGNDYLDKMIDRLEDLKIKI